MVATDLAWSGKLPSRGDFLEGGDRALLGWMQDWAAEGMVAIRDGGGPAADAFLTAPIQRFVGARDSLAPDAVIGVLGPGMDRAGRLYPFAMACRLDSETDARDTWMANAAWFECAEELYLGCLVPGFDPDQLGTEMEGLENPAPAPPAGGEAGLAAFGIKGAEVTVTQGCPSFAAIFGPSLAGSADRLVG